MMQVFQAILDFKAKGFEFETGNQYSAEKYGATADDVARWHAAGFIHIEGADDNELITNGRVRPANLTSTPRIK